MSEINKNFKPMREEIGLSQQDAALLIGITRVTYAKYEEQPETMPIGKYELLMREFKRLKKLKK